MATSGMLGRVALVRNVVSSSQILVSLMMEGLSSSETSVLTRATRRNIPEEALLPWLLVRKRTITAERPPPVGEFYYQLLWIEGCRVVSATDPLRPLISVL
jgi:hypothetical protein